MELLELKFDSSLHDAAESQIFSLHDAAASQILPLHDAARSQILPPHDAAGSQILPPFFLPHRNFLYSAAVFMWADLLDLCCSRLSALFTWMSPFKKRELFRIF